jgi:Na+/melibiose symporter-like transporter
VVTGIALGAELTCPSLLIGQLIAARGHQGQAEGQYFGYWSLLNKLALALAAGLSLPLLQAFGYTPGSPSEPPLALPLTYAAIPCGLKLLALMILPETPTSASTHPTPLPNKGVPL